MKVNCINEYSKLVQKEYKSKHDWVRKVINWELYKRFKFDPLDKQYMNKLEFVPEND